MDQDQRQLTFLIVDDDALNQRLMRILLSKRGHLVETASNGMEALEAIKSRKFDLVLMDLQLPGLNGLEVSRMIREWESGNTHVPIVALAASNVPEDTQEWFKAGIDHYVSKVNGMKQLSRIMDFYAENKASPASRDSLFPVEDEAKSAPVLDIKSARSNFLDDIDSYKMLLGEFITSLPAKVAQMQSDYDLGRWKELYRSAHDLKGVAASLGAMQLSKLSIQLEHDAEAGLFALTEEILLEIKQGMPELQSQVREFLTS